MYTEYVDKFNIEGKVVVITGGAGLLGEMHAAAIIEAKGIPVLLDINELELSKAKRRLNDKYPGRDVITYSVDIVQKKQLREVLSDLVEKGMKVYGLINNASNNPDMKGSEVGSGRFEDFNLDVWQKDLAVGLTGAFLCCQVFGTHMAENNGGVILNISSDLGIIAPTQYLYEVEGLLPEEQPKKPVTYSVVKTGLIGLTRYMATYWADKNVRTNAIAFGGVYNNQGDVFVKKLVKHIPMGRMAERDEYVCSIIYLMSEASSYMTGTVVTIDGGRTAW